MKKVVVAAGLLLALGIAGVVALVYLRPVAVTRALVDSERRRSGLVRREIVLPDGLRYVYLEGGTGEPLLLLHGFGANKDNFTRVARWLVPRYRVVIPDQIGFGESSHPDDADYAPLAQARRLHAFAAALGITSVDVGGSSMGGQIALTYAATYPEETRSLWLLDPAGVWSAPASELRAILRDTGHNPLMAQSTDEFAQIFRFVMSEPPFIPRPILDVMAQERIDNFALEKKIFAQIAADSVEERIKGLQTPALIVFGEHDRAINPATAEVLHAALPRSSVVVMKGLGHLPMLEQPRQTADDYLVFRNR